jgi:hypothetical protein
MPERRSNVLGHPHGRAILTPGYRVIHRPHHFSDIIIFLPTREISAFGMNVKSRTKFPFKNYRKQIIAPAVFISAFISVLAHVPNKLAIQTTNMLGDVFRGHRNRQKSSRQALAIYPK